MCYENTNSFYPKQCDDYYKALEDKDGAAAHYLHLPPVYKNLDQIQSEMRFQNIVDTFESEMKRIEETPNDILKLELEMRFKVKTQKKTFLERLFNI